MLQHLADPPEAIGTRAREEHYSPFGTEDPEKWGETSWLWAAFSMRYKRMAAALTSTMALFHYVHDPRAERDDSREIFQSGLRRLACNALGRRNPLARSAIRQPYL